MRTFRGRLRSLRRKIIVFFGGKWNERFQRCGICHKPIDKFAKNALFVHAMIHAFDIMYKAGQEIQEFKQRSE